MERAADFVGVYASASAAADHAEWLTLLEPWSTPELFSGLVATEPARLPTGEPVKVTYTAVEDDAAVIEIRLDSGISLLVTLEPSIDGWLVSDVRDAE